MNKQDLSSHTKLSIENLDEVLSAALLPLEAEDYSPEQVQMVEAIIHLVESKQAKTYKEAGNLYRKGQNEHQLNEIALRHQIPGERVPDFLKALKLKAESLTEQQFEAFREVCLAVQSGIDLSLAAQTYLNKVKGSKAKAAPKAETAIAKTDGGAIAETSEASESESEAIALLGAIPNQQSLRDKARQEATLDRSGFTTDAVEEIFNTSDHLRGLGKNYGRQLYVEEFQAAMNDPEAIEESQRIIDEISRLRRPNRKP